MKVVYVAPHRTYVIDSDGSTLAIADSAPHELPQTVNTQSFGVLYAARPNRVQLVGAWLEYLKAMARFVPLWPGEKLRIRYWLEFAGRDKYGKAFLSYRRFDGEVTL